MAPPRPRSTHRSTETRAHSCPSYRLGVLVRYCLFPFFDSGTPDAAVEPCVRAAKHSFCELALRPPKCVSGGEIESQTNWSYAVQLNLSDEQVKILADLVASRIKEIHPEIRRSRVSTVHDELRHDLETLQELADHLQQAWEAKQAEAWENYAETRKLPSNPPPGS